MGLKREQIVAGVVVFALTFSGFALFEYLGIDTKGAVLEPLTLQNMLISDRGVDLASFFAASLSRLLVYVAPMVLLTLAFAALGVHGLVFGEDRRLGPMAAGAGALAGTAYVGFSFTSVMMVVGMAVGAAFVPGVAIRQFREASKWKNYRSVAKAAGRGILVLNVFLSFGVFLVLVSDIDGYTNLFLSETQAGVAEAFGADLSDEELVERMPANVRSQYDDLSPAQQEEFLTDYRRLIAEQSSTQATDESVLKLVSLYIYTTPLVVFGTIEFLRSTFLVHLAGLAAVPVMRKRARIEAMAS